jgi:hypothetical protein
MTPCSSCHLGLDEAEIKCGVPCNNFKSWCTENARLDLLRSIKRNHLTNKLQTVDGLE